MSHALAEYISAQIAYRPRLFREPRAEQRQLCTHRLTIAITDDGTYRILTRNTKPQVWEFLPKKPMCLALPERPPVLLTVFVKLIPKPQEVRKTTQSGLYVSKERAKPQELQGKPTQVSSNSSRVRRGADGQSSTTC